jgi:drug/metabolite transporter (DMT)-like permease
MILVFLLYFIWALMLFVNKEVMLYCTHPLFIGGLRAFFSGLLIVFYSLFFQKTRIRVQDLSKAEWKKFFIFTFVLYGLAISGFSLGIDYVSPIAASFIYSVGPFITAALMYFLYKEALSVNKIIGLIIGSAGVLAIVLCGHEDAGMKSSMYGVIVFVISMFLYCYSWILFKDVFVARKNESQLLNGMAMTLGGGSALLASIIFKVPDDSMRLLFVEHSGLVAAFVILTAWGYGLYSYLLTKYSATFLSFAGFLDPVFGTFLGVLFFGYPFHIIFIYSFILLFIGLYLFYKEELKLSQR